MTLNRRTFLFILNCFSFLWSVKNLEAEKPGAKKSQAKGPEVVLIDSGARVEDQKIMLDGHVRNASEKPIRKLTVVYEILDSDKHVLTRQKGSIEEDVLNPGDEAAFSAQTQYPARSVFYRFEFEDGNQRELRAEKTGPFPLE